MAFTSVTASRSQTSPSKYHQKTPIDPQRQTRLLVLLPGSSDEQFACSLVRHDFSSHAAANYEALSYVWGRGGTPVKICVNNIGDYEITPNLAKALCNLRQPGTECRLLRESWQNSYRSFVTSGERMEDPQ
ncbi:hypothetical protein CERZMDRAFT_98632 [Cercospora zeae-maydis SCOH1-5]|uniref:Uncharacterized protein n=1 Tax=Cercospora zeae-maydis SCOH1-5 TaxID=717836 RepID=A0A6A6FD64_9PEZI|nr:hypothetical protein CERZMDRAFT_98632 [Cercospora zeae-maydis SCOH1-5]